MLLEGNGVADGDIDLLLDLADFLLGHLGEVGEVETEALVVDGRAFLLDMGAEDVAQGVVQQVGGRVVALDGKAAALVDFSLVGLVEVLGQLGGDMDDEVVLLLGVEDGDHVAGGVGEGSVVAYLTAALAVEGGAVEDELVELLVLGTDAAIAGDAHLGGDFVVADEGLFHFGDEFLPVVIFDGGGGAGTVLLGLKAAGEAFHVNGPTLLGGHELREVDGEAVGVEQLEGEVAVDGAGLFGAADIFLEAADAGGEGAQEGLLLLEDDAGDELLLLGKLGVLVSHLLDEGGDELVDEGLLESEEGIAVAHGTAQDATDDVSCLGVGGQLPVGDGERDGAEVVGDDAHGDVVLFTLSIGAAAEGGDLLDEGLEDVGVVVRLLALYHHAEALEAHAGVDMLGLQGLQCAVGEAVELHEDEVPYLDDEGVVLVDEFFTGHFGFLLGAAEVDMYLAAGAAGTLLAHLPEVVLLRAAEDALLGDMLLPVAVGLGVHLEVVALVASEDGDVEVLLVDVHHLGEELPGVGDGLLLEVVTKAPIAQHLEHRVVVGVVSHLFEVVVLAADAQALLCVAGAGVGRGGVAEEDVLELVHARVGEHEGGVVLHYHGSRGDHGVLLALEEIEEGFADFVASHFQFSIFNFSKLVPLHKEDGVLRDDEVLRAVILDFDGVLGEEEGQVAGLHLQGEVAGALGAAVPHLALVEGRQGVARAAFEDIARKDLLVVLVARGQVKPALGAVDGVVGSYQHPVAHHDNLVNVVCHVSHNANPAYLLRARNTFFVRCLPRCI